MGDLSLSTLLTILFGSGVLGLVGIMLTTRESRQKRYDERMDAGYKRLDDENQELRQRVRELERADDLRMEEEARLRYLLRSHGIDPDSPAVVNP